MEQSNLSKYFKALSCEQRLKVYQMIRDGEEVAGQCTGLLKAFSAACDLLQISRSTVSHHMKELENAGLIDCSKQGQSVCCQINQEALAAMKKFLEGAV